MYCMSADLWFALRKMALETFASNICAKRTLLSKMFELKVFGVLYMHVKPKGDVQDPFDARGRS